MCILYVKGRLDGRVCLTGVVYISGFRIDVEVLKNYRPVSNWAFVSKVLYRKLLLHNSTHTCSRTAYSSQCNRPIGEVIVRRLDLFVCKTTSSVPWGRRRQYYITQSHMPQHSGSIKYCPAVVFFLSTTSHTMCLYKRRQIRTKTTVLWSSTRVSAGPNTIHLVHCVTGPDHSKSR